MVFLHATLVSDPNSLSLLSFLFLMALLALLWPQRSEAQVKPPLPRGRELHGNITVTISGQATWREEVDDRSTTFRVSRTANHIVKINSDEAFPGNAQGVAVYRG